MKKLAATLHLKVDLTVKEQLAHRHLPEPGPMQANPKPPAPLTNSQMVLSLYYLLKAQGKALRGTVDLATIARFMHLLLGKEYITLHNSDLYRKLQLVPELQSRPALLKDLQLLQPLFEQVELSAVARLVEQAITIAMDR